MHDAQGRVALPGFYESGAPVRIRGARRGWRSCPMDEPYSYHRVAPPALWGEPEYTPLERTTARPTLEVLSSMLAWLASRRPPGKGCPFLSRDVQTQGQHGS